MISTIEVYSEIRVFNLSPKLGDLNVFLMRFLILLTLRILSITGNPIAPNRINIPMMMCRLNELCINEL